MDSEHEEHERHTTVKYLRTIATCMIVLVIILIFTNLSAFSGVFSRLMGVLASVLYGFLYAYLLNPLVKMVDRPLQKALCRRMKNEKAARRLSRVAGMIFAFIVAGLLIYAMIVLIFPQLIESISGIIASLPDYYRSIEQWVLSILEDNPEIKEYADIAMERGYEFLEDFIKNDLLGSVQKVVVGITTSAFTVVREVVRMVIGVVVAVYVLLSKDKFLEQSKKMVVAFFEPETADRVMEDGRQIDRIFNGFIIGKLIDSLIIGILCYIGVTILQIPYAVLVATIVGITNLIPYFGPIIGTVPCALLILLVSPIKCLYFIIFVVILQQIDGNIIGPRILGENVGISGFWILVSITVGGGLFGFIGMLLGVPVFAVIYMLVSEAVDRALQRRGRSTRTRDYHAIRRVSDLDAKPPEEDGEADGERSTVGAEGEQHG